MTKLRAFLKKGFAAWLARVLDDETGGIFDRVEADGSIDPSRPKLLLVQARMLFSLSHVALLSGEETRAALLPIAVRLAGHLESYKQADGLYSHRHGGIPHCYDQSFVLLALATFYKLAPSPKTLIAMEEIWLASHLMRDSKSGLFQDEGQPLAQNPQMHFFEALLQAYEMTGVQIWLERASQLRIAAMAQFFDEASGSLAEFLDNSRREPGHQYEWAWLLLREASFRPEDGLLESARLLAEFAEKFGRIKQGPLSGAAYDAVKVDGAPLEQTALLWPQTEAIKYFVVSGRLEEADALMTLIFKHWFVKGEDWVNQLDAEGQVLQAETFSRLFYHLVLAITEGARAGAWPGGFQA